MTLSNIKCCECPSAALYLGVGQLASWWPAHTRPPSKVYRPDEEPRSRNLGQFAYLPILVSILQATKITSVGRGRISKIYFKHKACFYFCKGNCIARQSGADIIKHHVIQQRAHMCCVMRPNITYHGPRLAKLLQAFEVNKIQNTVDLISEAETPLVTGGEAPNVTPTEQQTSKQ